MFLFTFCTAAVWNRTKADINGMRTICIRFHFKLNNVPLQATSNDKSIESFSNLPGISFGHDVTQKEFAESCDKLLRKKRLKDDWNLLPINVRHEYEEPELTSSETRALSYLREKRSSLRQHEPSWKQCRFCLTTNINSSMSLSQLSEGLLDVAQTFFQVTMYDGFPQHVCTSCLNSLRTIYEFREKCKSSHLALLTLALEEICPRTTDVKLEETNDLLLLSNVIEAKSQMEEYSITEHDIGSHSDHETGTVEEIYDNKPKRVDLIFKRHICEYCSKSFKTKLSLKIHIRSHTNERPFNCPECGKTFKTYSAVHNHRAVHSTDKNFKCPVPDCNYRTTTKANLNIHGRTHTQERFVLFALCYHFQFLSFHFRKYACVYCQLKFTTTSNLSKHVKNIHHQIKAHKCSQCEKMVGPSYSSHDMY